MKHLKQRYKSNPLYREKVAISVWLGKDVIESVDQMGALGFSRSGAIDTILKNHFDRKEEK